MSNSNVYDFLGTPMHIGDRAIRVHSFGHWKEFKKVTIKEFNALRGKDFVGIITDGNTKIGWTYPERLIVQNSLSIEI